MFELLACYLATLAIAMLFYGWRDGFSRRPQPHQIRERVAYMLWVSAQRG